MNSWPNGIGFEILAFEVFFIVLFGLKCSVGLIYRRWAPVSPTVVGLWAFMVGTH